LRGLRFVSGPALYVQDRSASELHTLRVGVVIALDKLLYSVLKRLSVPTALQVVNTSNDKAQVFFEHLLLPGAASLPGKGYAAKRRSYALSCNDSL